MVGAAGAVAGWGAGVEGAGVSGIPAAPPVAPLAGAGAVGAGAAGCVKAWSSTDFGARRCVEAIESTSDRKRKIPAPHQLAFVSRLPA